MANLQRFAERNPVLLQELRELVYGPPQEFVGGERYITGYESAKFHTLGSAHSQTLDRIVHVGSKTKNDLKTYFGASLANLLFLEECVQELGEIVPLVMGAVVDKNGDYKFIFMEDYSRGKSAEVTPMDRSRQAQIPDCLKGFMEPPDSHFKYDDLAKAFVFVDGKLRLLDLDTLPWLGEHQQKIYEKRAMFEIEHHLLEPHLIRL